MPCCIPKTATVQPTTQTEGSFDWLMLQRLRLVILSGGGAGLLLLVLCLGAQNLSERRVLNLGIGKTAPLPTGFIVGVSAVLGVLSGGSVAAVVLPQQRD